MALHLLFESETETFTSHPSVNVAGFDYMAMAARTAWENRYGQRFDTRAANDFEEPRRINVKAIKSVETKRKKRAESDWIAPTAGGGEPSVWHANSYREQYLHRCRPTRPHPSEKPCPVPNKSGGPCLPCLAYDILYPMNLYCYMMWVKCRSEDADDVSWPLPYTKRFASAEQPRRAQRVAFLEDDPLSFRVPTLSSWKLRNVSRPEEHFAVSANILFLPTLCTCLEHQPHLDLGPLSDQRAVRGENRKCQSWGPYARLSCRAGFEPVHDTWMESARDANSEYKNLCNDWQQPTLYPPYHLLPNHLNGPPGNDGAKTFQRHMRTYYQSVAFQVRDNMYAASKIAPSRATPQTAMALAGVSDFTTGRFTKWKENPHLHTLVSAASSVKALRKVARKRKAPVAGADEEDEPEVESMEDQERALPQFYASRGLDSAGLVHDVSRPVRDIAALAEAEKAQRNTHQTTVQAANTVDPTNLCHNQRGPSKPEWMRRRPRETGPAYMIRLFREILEDVRRMDREENGQRRLNSDQFDLLCLVVYYLVKKKALGLDEGLGCLLLGQGGTGKTFVGLKYLVPLADALFAPDDDSLPATCAMAFANQATKSLGPNASTIHRTCQIPVFKITEQHFEQDQVKDKLEVQFSSLALMLLDEISLVPCSLYYWMRHAVTQGLQGGATDGTSRLRYHNQQALHKVPVWITMGDFLQLPPPMAEGLGHALPFFEARHRRHHGLPPSPPPIATMSATTATALHKDDCDLAKTLRRRLQRDTNAATRVQLSKRLDQLYLDAAFRAHSSDNLSGDTREACRLFAAQHRDVLVFRKSRRCDDSASGKKLRQVQDALRAGQGLSRELAAALWQCRNRSFDHLSLEEMEQTMFVAAEWKTLQTHSYISSRKRAALAKKVLYIIQAADQGLPHHPLTASHRQSLLEIPNITRTKYLPGHIWLYEGMRVRLTENMCPAAGLTKDTAGRVIDIIFDDREQFQPDNAGNPPPERWLAYQPRFIKIHIVDSDGNRPRIVDDHGESTYRYPEPIILRPQSYKVDLDLKRVACADTGREIQVFQRTQFALYDGLVFTANACQGMTMRRLIVSCEAFMTTALVEQFCETTGCDRSLMTRLSTQTKYALGFYVMLSRVRNLDSLSLVHTTDRLERVINQGIPAEACVSKFTKLLETMSQDTVKKVRQLRQEMEWPEWSSLYSSLRSEN